MRKDIIEEIEDFIKKHKLEDIRNETHDLCMHVHSSGWVDGSNDYIEEYDSEDADEEDLAELWDLTLADGLTDEEWGITPDDPEVIKLLIGIDPEEKDE